MIMQQREKGETWTEMFVRYVRSRKKQERNVLMCWGIIYATRLEKYLEMFWWNKLFLLFAFYMF